MATAAKALPLSSQSFAIASFDKHGETHHYYSYLSRTRTAAVCNMSLLIQKIDGSEGEDNPPRVTVNKA